MNKEQAFSICAKYSPKHARQLFGEMEFSKWMDRIEQMSDGPEKESEKKKWFTAYGNFLGAPKVL